MCRFALALHGLYSPNSILRSPKQKLNLKICLFKAAWVSILFNGYQTWIYAETFWEGNLTSLEGHATGLFWVSNKRKTMKQTRYIINEFTKCWSAKLFASGSSSSQVFACLPTSPSTALSYTNIKLAILRPSIRLGTQTRKYRQKIKSHLLPGEKELEATQIW